MSEPIYVKESIIKAIGTEFCTELTMKGRQGEKPESLYELREVMKGKDIRLLWSGGVDSTALFEALLILKPREITVVSTQIVNNLEKNGREASARKTILKRLKEHYPDTYIRVIETQVSLPFYGTPVTEDFGLKRSQYHTHLNNCVHLESGLDYIMTGFIRDDIQVTYTRDGRTTTDVSLFYEAFEALNMLNQNRKAILLMPLIDLTKKELIKHVTDEMFQDAEWCEHADVFHGEKKLRLISTRRVVICDKCTPCRLLGEAIIVNEVYDAMLEMSEGVTEESILKNQLVDKNEKDIK